MWRAQKGAETGLIQRAGRQLEHRLRGRFFARGEVKAIELQNSTPTTNPVRLLPSRNGWFLTMPAVYFAASSIVFGIGVGEVIRSGEGRVQQRLIATVTISPSSSII